MQDGSDAELLVLPSGADINVAVTYQPTLTNEESDSGTLADDTGTVRVLTNVNNDPIEITLSGLVIHLPVAVIECVEGSEVPATTLLHLQGDQSYCIDSLVALWDWYLEQPFGATSVFLPASSYPNPTLEANVVGKYTVNLMVYNEKAFPSAEPTLLEIGVNPIARIHVELVWHTPEDPDETDEGTGAGADHDLHLLHPLASGQDVDEDGVADGWFDPNYDCYVNNQHPDWGKPHPETEDDPQLFRDDNDGAGPEILVLDAPEDLTYRLGVYYANDHGFGASYATIRVWIDDMLALKIKDVKLVHGDLWEVGEMMWPSGEVNIISDVFGDYKILHDYPTP